MSDHHLVVVLYGEVAGIVAQDDRGELHLRYDDGWRRRESSTPVSLSMPLTKADHHEPVSAFLSGLLPDNDRVLERWGRRFGASPRNPFALLEHVGEDCAGAVQLVRPDRLDALAESSREPLTDDDVASAIQELRTDPTAWHAARTGGQFSLAGAQAKMALLHEDGAWFRPSGRTPTTHILKPAVPGYVGHDLNEHLCLEAARRLGMPAARSEVQIFGEERAIVVTRYDRLRTDDGWQRIHQEDCCQALGVHPVRKYQHDGGPSPEAIITLLRETQDLARAATAVERFVDALLLHWLLVAPDAHAKNYSLLLRRSQVRLAPLYDIASILPYADVHVPKVKLAMKIGGEYVATKVVGRHWDRFAEAAGLDGGAVRARAAELAQRLPDALADAAGVEGVDALGSDLPLRLVDAVAARCQKAAAALDR